MTTAANNDNLLAPSLERDTARPIYSVGALIAAAFFGGAYAVLLLVLENCRRLGRLRQQSVWLGLLFIAVTAALVGAVYYSDLPTSAEAGRNIRLLNRGIAFALVGAAYLMHRRVYRAGSAMGIDPPSPYLAVVGAVIAGYLIAVGMLAAIQYVLFQLFAQAQP